MKESLTYSLIPNNNPALEEKRKNIPSIFLFFLGFDKENWLEMFCCLHDMPAEDGSRVQSPAERDTGLAHRRSSDFLSADAK